MASNLSCDYCGEVIPVGMRLSEFVDAHYDCLMMMDMGESSLEVTPIGRQAILEGLEDEPSQNDVAPQPKGAGRGTESGSSGPSSA